MQRRNCDWDPSLYREREGTEAKKVQVTCQQASAVLLDGRDYGPCSVWVILL